MWTSWCGVVRCGGAVVLCSSAEVRWCGGVVQ